MVEQTEQKTETPVEQIALVSSIKMKTIGCNPKAVAAFKDGDTSLLHLARVIGMISSLIHGEMEDGSQYIALGGRFQATNMQTGTDAFGVTFESGKCFLPPGTHESLIGQARKIGTVNPGEDKRKGTQELPLKDGKVVNFAIDVFVRKDSNASGITYVSKSILEPTEADPMAELRRGIASFERRLQGQLNAGAGEKQKQLNSAGRK